MGNPLQHGSKAFGTQVKAVFRGQGLAEQGIQNLVTGMDNFLGAFIQRLLLFRQGLPLIQAGFEFIENGLHGGGRIGLCFSQLRYLGDGGQPRLRQTEHGQPHPDEGPQYPCFYYAYHSLSPVVCEPTIKEQVALCFQWFCWQANWRKLCAEW